MRTGRPLFALLILALIAVVSLLTGNIYGAAVAGLGAVFLWKVNQRR